MCQQLHQAMINILKMPYYRNYHAMSGNNAKAGHEVAVDIEIAKASFTRLNVADYPSITKGLLKAWAQTKDDQELRRAAANMPMGSYIAQPAGSQGFPDFLVRDFNDRYVSIECKSGKKAAAPMWNDNVPMDDAIYVLTAENLNETTVFLGRDVISPEERELMIEQERATRALNEEFVKRSKAIDKFKRGFVQKIRKQHFQSGPASQTNYFIHKDRNLCESNVLEFAAK